MITRLVNIEFQYVCLNSQYWDWKERLIKYNSDELVKNII